MMEVSPARPPVWLAWAHSLSDSPILHAHVVEGRLLTARVREHTQVPELDGLVFGIRDYIGNVHHPISVQLQTCMHNENFLGEGGGGNSYFGH